MYCAAGTYSDEKGLATCKKCLSGTSGTVDESGATDSLVHCLKCAKGQFQKFDGQTTCEKCEADTYTPAAGHHMKDCIACKVVDSKRRFSTFGKAGEDHCDPVALDCKPSPYSAYDTCTLSCGSGFHTRTRQPARQPAEPSACGLADPQQCNQAWGGGKACDHEDYVWSETDTCNAHACPIDCEYTQWGHWEPCSKGCDSGGTHRVRSITVEPEFGGSKCPAMRDPPTGLSPCNQHKCEHGGQCGVEHVRCNVLMLEHHKSSFAIRGDLSTCGHSSIEEQNICWNNNSCKTCKGSDKANSNVDHCNKEACHDADTDSERALHNRLEADYKACQEGTDGRSAANKARKEAGLPERQCRKLFPTLQVTHDRTHMDVLSHFKCAKTSPTTCACKCDKHPACCAKKNMLLSNTMLFGNRFNDVDTLQECCNMCTNHPSCGAWEYTTERICVLKSGSPSYAANPFPEVVTSWSGTPSGVGSC